MKLVMERIVKAFETSPAEIAPGQELRLTVSCGVAEYRFGIGSAGVIAEADKAMFAAKELARRDQLSHINYWNETQTQ